MATGQFAVVLQHIPGATYRLLGEDRNTLMEFTVGASEIRELEVLLKLK